MQLSYPRAEEADDGDAFVNRVVFKRGARYPEAKIFSFNKHSKDFAFAINYGDLSFLPEREVAYVQLCRTNFCDVFLY